MLSVKGQNMASVNNVKYVTKFIFQISVRKITHVKKSIVTRDPKLCVLTLKPMENVNGHPPSADVRYGEEDSISPYTHIFAIKC